jgi:hypothetical protein
MQHHEMAMGTTWKHHVIIVGTSWAYHHNIIGTSRNIIFKNENKKMGTFLYNSLSSSLEDYET